MKPLKIHRQNNGLIHVGDPSGDSMAEALTIVVSGIHHPVVAAFLQRGMHQQHRFFVPEDELDSGLQKFETECTLFPDALRTLSVLNTSPDVVFTTAEKAQAPQIHSLRGGMNLALVEAKQPHFLSETWTQLILHDLLTIDNPLDNDGGFQEWWQLALGVQEPTLKEEQIAFWCSAGDVAESLLRLIQSEVPLPSPMDVCGRRRWSLADTWQEFNLLVQRTVAGERAKFEATHLKADGGPLVEVQDLNHAIVHRERPNVEPYHDALVMVSGEGWNPRTPLRQSLMLLVAELVHLHGYNSDES